LLRNYALFKTLLVPSNIDFIEYVDNFHKAQYAQDIIGLPSIGDFI